MVINKNTNSTRYLCVIMVPISVVLSPCWGSSTLALLPLWVLVTVETVVAVVVVVVNVVESVMSPEQTKMKLFLTFFNVANS